MGDARNVIDGDGNGVINIADITTIGQNFGSTIDSFGVYGSADTADHPDTNAAESAPGARLVGSRPFSTAHGGGTQRRYWDLEIKTPVIGDPQNSASISVAQYSASQNQVSELQGITVGGHPALAINQGSQNRVYFAVYY